MTHAANYSVNLTALDSKLGSLTQELAAFRAEIGAMPAAAASEPAGPVDADLDCRFDELGVIAYVLGLRQPGTPGA